ncbi:MAG: hypothetical protein ACRDQZ_21765 [Mycobacteriales bacterium]
MAFPWAHGRKLGTVRPKCCLPVGERSFPFDKDIKMVYVAFSPLRTTKGSNMSIMTISLDLPEGTRVSIKGVEGATITPGQDTDILDLIQKYWDDYLSNNGRRIFETAARIEHDHGPGYSLEDIAQTLGLDYESVKSMHRSTGRTKKRWEREQSTEAPIQLEWETYDWEDSSQGQRTRYHLPDDVAGAILALL